MFNLDSIKIIDWAKDSGEARISDAPVVRVMGLAKWQCGQDISARLPNDNPLSIGESSNSNDSLQCLQLII